MTRKEHLAGIAAIVAAGFGIVLGNTVADVTDATEQRIFSSNGSSTVPRDVTLMCIPLEN